MATGPSKQDLEMYWQNSRQYFDELAKYYQSADPEYYREYMKPFYDNPFNSTYAGGNKKSGSGKKLILVAVILFALIGLLSAGAFFLLSKSDSISKKIEEITSDKEVSRKTTEKTTGTENNKDNSVDEKTTVEEEDPSELSGEDNFIIGAKYIGEKKYDKAAWHLKQIKEGDKRYKEAQQLLESIKFLKKYDK